MGSGNDKVKEKWAGGIEESWTVPPLWELYFNPCSQERKDRCLL